MFAKPKHPIYSKEAQTSGWNVVEFEVGMSPKFSALLGSRINVYRTVHLIIGTVRYLLIGTIDIGRTDIDQMLYNTSVTPS